MRNGFKIIDADAHFYEPADIWDRYVEPEYFDRRPIVTKLHGKSIFEYADGKTMGAMRSETLLSMMEEKFGHAFRDEWSVESRIKDMDNEGWDIQVCLPTNASEDGAPDYAEPDVAAALCRAYNNWAHEFCSDFPTRLKFTAVVPGQDLLAMAKETRRAVDNLGAISIVVPKAIPDKMWHHNDYDPVWATLQELDCPLSLHGAYSGEPLANARYQSMTGPFVAMGGIINFPFENMISMAHFMFSGILDRFPNLRLLILEATAGWLPFWLHRLDTYTEGRQAVFFGENLLKLSPREYFERQCAVAADADEPTLKYVIDYIGNKNIVFNTDYPHPDALAPSEALEFMMAQPVSDESKKNILWDNSVKIYGNRIVSGHPLANS